MDTILNAVIGIIGLVGVGGMLFATGAVQDLWSGFNLTDGDDYERD